MEFIAIIAVLISKQVLAQLDTGQFDDWLLAVQRKLHWVSNERFRLLLQVFVPVLVVVALERVLSGVLWGALQLMLYIIILFYSLGRGDFKATLTAYYAAWRRGDLEAAFQQAQHLHGFDNNVSIDNAIDLHQSVRKAVFYEGFERWFAVVFWFFLLGPAAALAYRLVCLQSANAELNQEPRKLIDQLHYYVDWIPARLLMFTFALIGNFDRCIGACREQFLEPIASSDLLDLSGRLAIAAPLPETVADTEFAELAVQELESSETLLARSLLCWVVCLAILQLL